MNDTPPNVPQLLASAKRWFDDALEQSMRDSGEQPVTVAQAAVFANLDARGTSVAELARRIGTTRQSVHQAVHGLIAIGLLEQVDDPTSARSRLVRVTDEGHRVHSKALSTIDAIERELATRIGEDAVTALRTALDQPWGGPPLIR
ncbi:MarR family winged helix-turn-helix transcriptional regulator [Saccharopolyspora sp. TS4A08]|uniref:MarR family winged helix-turn-helix transcriptional regulator n=1 Tax=Saccharopolyspora ipomoeae TaxID=3042027 RepID=A0ABT6PIK9_9PSEU|nr:MarR family winged helix-turn-helix transcriptional regulator [Saccharopolyspora sp. TS4A08]MDI2027830.1 MarR family winged helix-turn-helix transcriptional regulator [Saccharopolyspora sp. TS4A08]